MYLHLGEEVLIKDSDIVGIFDLEKTSLSKHTKSFLSNATKNNQVVNVSYEMPKSFIVTSKEKKSKVDKVNKVDKVYISQISTQTLRKRAKR